MDLVSALAHARTVLATSGDRGMPWPTSTAVVEVARATLLGSGGAYSGYRIYAHVVHIIGTSRCEFVTPRRIAVPIAEGETNFVGLRVRSLEHDSLQRGVIVRYFGRPWLELISGGQHHAFATGPSDTVHVFVQDAGHRELAIRAKSDFCGGVCGEVKIVAG
jgi:hypothetical protein